MLRTFVACLLTVVAFSALAAGANEAAVRQAFQSKFAELPVESVAKIGMPGIYEVVAKGQTEPFFQSVDQWLQPGEVFFVDPERPPT